MKATTRTARTRRLARATAALGLVSLALTACSGSAPNFSDGFSVLGAVGQIPADAAPARYDLFAASTDKAREVSGLQDADAYTWIRSLMAANPQNPAPVIVIPPGAFVSGRELPVVNWQVSDLSQWVSLNAPPNDFTVVTGTELTLPDSLITMPDGLLTDREADDNAVDVGLGSAGNTVSKLGKPTRFAQNGDVIAFGSQTSVVKAWKDAGKTLADDPSVRAIAEALDAQDVVSAYITQPATFSGEFMMGQHLTPAQAEKALKDYDALIPPAPYDLLGVGWAAVDGKPRWVATYHFANDQDASDGAQVLRAVWEKGATLISQMPMSSFGSLDDVTTKGSTVTVTFNVNDKTAAVMLYQLVIQREVLFASR